MTFAYTDPDGDHLTADPDSLDDNTPVVTLETNGPIRIPVDRIEEVIAGLRDTARQAATGSTPTATTLPCNWARTRYPHAPHDWEPQPGMTPVHCPGGTP